MMALLRCFYRSAFSACVSRTVRLKKIQLLVCVILPFTEHAFFRPRQAAFTQKQSFAARQTQAEKRIGLQVKAPLYLYVPYSVTL